MEPETTKEMDEEVLQKAREQEDKYTHNRDTTMWWSWRHEMDNAAEDLKMDKLYSRMTAEERREMFKNPKWEEFKEKADAFMKKFDLGKRQHEDRERNLKKAKGDAIRGIALIVIILALLNVNRIYTVAKMRREQGI